MGNPIISYTSAITWFGEFGLIPSNLVSASVMRFTLRVELYSSTSLCFIRSTKLCTYLLLSKLAIALRLILLSSASAS